MPLGSAKGARWLDSDLRLEDLDQFELATAFQLKALSTSTATLSKSVVWSDVRTLCDSSLNFPAIQSGLILAMHLSCIHEPNVLSNKIRAECSVELVDET